MCIVFLTQSHRKIANIDRTGLMYYTSTWQPLRIGISIDLILFLCKANCAPGYL